MSERETEFLERWRGERPMYDAWGSFICAKLRELISPKIPISIELFLRVPMKHRLKDEDSLLGKAFYRQKNYDNPYLKIEDKVGARIVVLSSDDIKTVDEVVLASGDFWVSEKARDYEEERMLRPFEFDYQSVHYVLKARAGVEHNGVQIAEGTPCELQVRTLLQHAYSELTHDTLYKPNVAAEPDVKRAAAKSMALIEATDDYFTEVRRRIEQATASGEHLRQVLEAAYRDFVGCEPEPSPLNLILIDHYRAFAPESIEGDLRQFLADKPFVAERVGERAASQTLYRQPAALLVYWAIQQARRKAARETPLSHAELEPMYSDLGYRLERGLG